MGMFFQLIFASVTINTAVKIISPKIELANIRRKSLRLPISEVYVYIATVAPLKQYKITDPPPAILETYETWLQALKQHIEGTNLVL